MAIASNLSRSNPLKRMGTVRKRPPLTARLPLVAEQTFLIGFNRLQVGRWVAPVVQPILNQHQVVANSAAIEPLPVDALNPIALQPILLQR